MTNPLGPLVGTIITTSTPADTVRGWLGRAALKSSEAERELVTRMARAVDGNESDIVALAEGSLKRLRHLLDPRMVTRLAGAVGARDFDLSWRSTMTRAIDPAAVMDDESRPTYDFVMSTAASDRADDIVTQDWDLAGFIANPVAFWNHQSWAMPVGHWRNVRVEAGALVGTLVPTPSAAAPETVAVADMLRAGTIRAVSVGFRPRAVIARASLSEDDEFYSDRGYVYVKPMLLECSPCGIPMNGEATRRSIGATPAPTKPADGWGDFWTRKSSGGSFWTA